MPSTKRSVAPPSPLLNRFVVPAYTLSASLSRVVYNICYITVTSNLERARVRPRQRNGEQSHRKHGEATSAGKVRTGRESARSFAPKKQRRHSRWATGAEQ